MLARRRRKIFRELHFARKNDVFFISVKPSDRHCEKFAACCDEFYQFVALDILSAATRSGPIYFSASMKTVKLLINSIAILAETNHWHEHENYSPWHKLCYK
jgi:hypothetical protein